MDDEAGLPVHRDRGVPDPLRRRGSGTDPHRSAGRVGRLRGAGLQARGRTVASAGDPHPPLAPGDADHHLRDAQRGLDRLGRSVVLRDGVARARPGLLRDLGPAGRQPREGHGLPARLLGGGPVRLGGGGAGAVPGHAVGGLRRRPELLRAPRGVDDPAHRVLPTQRTGPGQASLVHPGAAVRPGRCGRCRFALRPHRRSDRDRRHHGDQARSVGRAQGPGRRRRHRARRRGVPDRLRRQPGQPPAGLRRPRRRPARPVDLEHRAHPGPAVARPRVRAAAPQGPAQPDHLARRAGAHRHPRRGVGAQHVPRHPRRPRPGRPDPLGDDPGRHHARVPATPVASDQGDLHDHGRDDAAGLLELDVPAAHQQQALLEPDRPVRRAPGALVGDAVARLRGVGRS